MTVRYYICPLVTDPSDLANRIPKVMTHPHIAAAAAAGVDPVNGALLKSWSLVRVEAIDWAAIDADSQCVDILEKLSDISGATTRAGIIAWLKAHTVQDVPPAARTRINNRLQAIGVSTTGITLATTLFEVVLRVYRILEPLNRMEDM